MRSRAAFVLLTLLAAALAVGCKPYQNQTDALIEARQTMKPLAPISGDLPNLAIPQAYDLQEALIARLCDGPDQVSGYKIAYAAKASQEKWGIPAPAYGRLLRSMHVDNGGTMRAQNFMMFHIEVEIAFTLAKAIDKPITSRDQLMPYIRSVHAGLDIPDNRFDPSIEGKGVTDVIADNTGAHRYAIGPAHDPAEVDVDALQPRLLINGKVYSQGSAKDVMGSPYTVLQWLANELLERGRQLEAGDVILTGAIGDSFVGPGEKAKGAYIGDCGPLGKVRVTVE